MMLRAIDKNISDSIVLLFIHSKVNSIKAPSPWAVLELMTHFLLACPCRCHGGSSDGAGEIRLFEDKEDFRKLKGQFSM